MHPFLELPLREDLSGISVLRPIGMVLPLIITSSWDFPGYLRLEKAHTRGRFTLLRLLRILALSLLSHLLVLSRHCFILLGGCL